MAIIAIEEHFTSPALQKLNAPRAGAIQNMLNDMTMNGQRVKDMDEAGIDICVLSENNPAAHNLEPDVVGDGRQRRRTISSTITSSRIRSGSPALPRCRCPIRRPPPTNSNAASPSSASRAR